MKEEMREIKPIEISNTDRACELMHEINFTDEADMFAAISRVEALYDELTALRSRVKELEDGKEAKRIELGNFLAETIADNLMGMRDTKEFSKEWAMCAGKKSLAESILIKFT